MKHALAALAALAAFGATTAAEANLASGTLNFDGAVLSACAFSNLQDGVIRPSADNKTLSTTGLGSPASLTVVANNNVVITFSALSVAASPTGYAGAPTLKLGLSGSTSGTIAPLAAGAQTATVAAPGETIEVSAQAESTAPFLAGDYRLTTVATCAAAPLSASSGEDDDG